MYKGGSCWWSKRKSRLNTVQKENDSEVAEALNLKANDYITKPLDFPVAIARIKMQVTRKHSEEAIRKSEPSTP
jgi:DNA-binding response OmpR family regulator